MLETANFRCGMTMFGKFCVHVKHVQFIVNAQVAFYREYSWGVLRCLNTKLTEKLDSRVSAEKKLCLRWRRASCMQQRCADCVAAVF